MTRIRLAFLGGVLAITAVAAGGFICADRAAARRAADGKLLLWARLGAAQMTDYVTAETIRAGIDTRRARSATPAYDIFRSWSLAMMREGEVFATALIDAQGTVLVSWPPSATLPKFAALPGTLPNAAVRHTETTPGLAARLAIAPLDRGNEVAPLAFACVLGDTAHAGVFSRRAIHVYVGTLAMWTAAVLVVGTAFLRRTVVKPLAQLNRRLPMGDPGQGRPADAWPEDPFDAITRKALDLAVRLDLADRHARRLERSIDTTVERRTKQISRLLRRAEHEAELDSLTGLANRRFIEQRLEELYAEQRSRRVNLVVIMLDVDNFKRLNDLEGHAAGDDVLRFIGELLRGALRESDVGVRYGGDEFAVFLVDITLADGRAIAERVVRLFAQRVKAWNYGTAVTLSAGIASLDRLHPTSGAQLLAAADEALYRAKRGGKNLVEQA